MKSIKVYMASKMMDCDQATYLMSIKDQRALNCKEKVSMHVHMMSCKVCRYYNDQIHSINQHLQAFKTKQDQGSLVFTLSDPEKEEMKSKLI